jgi:hypothetical protein
MSCVLKISRGSQLFRVVLEGQPDFGAVDAAVQRVLPGCGAADAVFGGDSEAHPLTLDAFGAFLATGRELASGQVVLRLDVPELREELHSATRPTLLQSEAPAMPDKLAKSRTQGASWAEDTRPLDELVAGLQEAPTSGPKKRSKKRGTQKSTSPSGGQGANSDLAQVGDDPLAPGKRDPDTDCGELAEECDSSAEFAVISTCTSEEDSDEDALDPGPPLPNELQRSSSCPAWAIPPLAAGIAAPQDLPPEPSEVWPPTPDSTPQNSPRFDYQMDCSMAADLMAQQQFVWVPVLVPVF